MNARELTHILGGHWHHRYGTAPCPVCQPEKRKDQNALTIANGHTGLLAHCKKSHCAYRDIISAVGIAPNSCTQADPSTHAQRKAKQRSETKRRAEQAKQIWREAIPIGGTTAEIYLRERGITAALPLTLRFHPSCWHGATAKRYPAMVALIEGSAGFAVHRTYLRADGTGKADITPTKTMLGEVSAGVVKLSCIGAAPLVVAEGIETALSLASGLLRRPANIWAALSTSGLRSLPLQNSSGQITIASDGDAAGRTAALALGERAHAAGWNVSLLPAPDGLDWNDVLINKEGEL